jgi:Helicase conserved C-terminal domain
MPLADRFRVERFAQWRASYPHFVYQINQRSLKRAADEGIAAQQILNFLKNHAAQVPERVSTALLRYAKV